MVILLPFTNMSLLFSLRKSEIRLPPPLNYPPLPFTLAPMPAFRPHPRL